MSGVTSQNDSEIIEGIRSGGITRQRYESLLFRKFAEFVRLRPGKYALTEEEARDCYTESFLAVVDHIVGGRFRGESSIKTYLSRIFRNKCVDRYRKNTTVSVDWTDEFPELPDDSKDFLRDLVGKEAIQRLNAYMDQLSGRCKDILRYSGLGFSPAEIAKELNFSSPGSASSQRFKCLGKLKKIMGSEIENGFF